MLASSSPTGHESVHVWLPVDVTSISEGARRREPAAGSASQDGANPGLAYGLTVMPVSCVGGSPKTAAGQIAVSKIQVPGKVVPNWYHRWDRPNGLPWLMFGRATDAFYLCFPGLADFRIGRSTSIAYWPAAQLPPSTLNHLLLDVVLPFYLSLRGELVCHGSAVTDGTATVAFVGPSGSGKSTLAAHLVTRGWRLLADDALVIRPSREGLGITPAYQGLRLWPDSASHLYPGYEGAAPVAHYMDKLRISPTDAAWPPPETPLKAVFLVEPGIRPLVERVSARDAVIALTASSFQLEVDDPAAIESSLAKISDLVRSVRVMRLSVPRDWAQLPEVEDAIRQAAGIA